MQIWVMLSWASCFSSGKYEMGLEKQRASSVWGKRQRYKPFLSNEITYPLAEVLLDSVLQNGVETRMLLRL